MAGTKVDFVVFVATGFAIFFVPAHHQHIIELIPRWAHVIPSVSLLLSYPIIQIKLALDVLLEGGECLE